MISRRDALKQGGLMLAAAALFPRHLWAEVGPVMSTLSAYMAAAKDRAIPPNILDETKHHVLDTFAAMVSGAELPAGQTVLAYARAQSGRPEATVAASMLVLPPVEAGMINGLLAHCDETDDSHGESQSHPGAAVVPAALALGEALKVSGMHFLRAVALGYDVGPRFTMALGGVDFRNETRRSTHAIAGNFGAAAAAGCVGSLNADQMRFLLDYSAQQASGFAVWERDVDHVEKAFMFGGMPARNGVQAATFVRSGFTGVDDVLSGPDNFFQVNGGRPELLVDGLGERYEVARTDIKKWTVGSPVQAPLDAIVNIRRQRDFSADDVQKVVVKLAPNVGRVVNNRDIPDISLQHMIAVMLVDKTASFHAAHDKERMTDPVILRHRAKVDYVPDPDLQQFMPARVAVVEVTLNDGTRMTDRVDAVRGTVRNPMTREEIVDKSRDLLAPVLGAQKSQGLIDAVLNLDGAADVTSLRPFLQRA